MRVALSGVGFCVALACVLSPLRAQGPAPRPLEVPEENRLTRRGEPPPRPPLGDTEARVVALFEAIKTDRPQSVDAFFFPREPFLILKGIADPERYWHVLMRHYRRDIHALHESLPHVEEGEFLRFVFRRRGGWVGRREEGNALPYWVSRHSWIYYRARGREHRFEIRALINWGPRWYVTHLR